MKKRIFQAILWSMIIGFYGYIIWIGGGFAEFLVVTFMLYPIFAEIFSIKMPCSYNSYKSWWADRANWRKRVPN